MILRIKFTKHLWFMGAFLFLGCSTYQSYVAGARDALERKEFDSAIVSLQKLAETKGGDQLAYLLEYATALHQAGRYAESNKAFEQANKLTDINDYTSVSREAGTYVVNEGMVQFKPETFEFLLISIYQALNYIMLKDYENAQVMSRQIVEKLNKIEIDKDSKRRQSAFAAYLSAMIWEAQGDWDNAFVLYTKAHDAASDVEQYRRDLLIAARRSGRTDAYEKYQKLWPDLDKKIPWTQIRQQGEFVFIFQQGWIPRKRMRPENRQLPMLVPVPQGARRAQVVIDGTATEESQPVYDLESISIQTLEEDYKRLVAKAVARAASRVAVRQAAIHNNKNSGMAAAAIASFVLEAMDQADLRQWSTLPARFQVIRVYLPAGKHTLRVSALDNSAAAKQIWDEEVNILKGQKIFATQRAY